MDCAYKEFDNTFTSNLEEDHTKVKCIEKLEGTDFIYGGLNLIKGFTEVDKAYQLVKLLGESSENVDITYLDADEAKDENFVKHCDSNCVFYATRMTASLYCKENTATWLDAILDMIETFIEDTKKDEPDCKLVLVLDSMSSIGEGQEIKNDENVSPLLYKLSHHAQELDYCLILIDHV